MIGWIRSWFIGDPGDPLLLDHVPTAALADWREPKLKQAAEKFGKPFKCAADGMPREVMKDRAFVPVGGKATVTPIRAKEKKS